MSKKRFKNSKTYERTSNDLEKQNHKVVAGFMEQQSHFCNLDKKQRNKKATREDVIAYGNSLADLYHQIQQNLNLLEKQYGAHYCFTAKSFLNNTEIQV